MSMSCACPPDLLARAGIDGSVDAARVCSALEAFCALLAKWQPAQNLVSRETLAELWTRHMLDSLQLGALIRSGDEHILDLGSGGGFPAIPLAIVLNGRGHRISLIEANGRKTAFLKTVSRELGLGLKVHNCRIEAADSRETGVADLVLARALAPLMHLFSLAFPLLASDGRLLFHKGREYGEEVRAAGADWAFDVLEHKSVSDRSGVVLEISHLRPKSDLATD